MSVPPEFNTEFEPFESDDVDVLAAQSPLQFLDFPGSETDGLVAFDPPSNAKGILSPADFSISSPAAISPGSANDSFQDSCSDSASEKRAASSASSKTPPSAGDLTMTDGPIVKPEWPIDALIQDDDPYHFQLFGEGTINPSTLDQTSGFNDKLMENDFDFESASSSPSPFNAAKTESPQMSSTNATTPAQAQAPAQVPPAGPATRAVPPTAILQPNNRKTAVPVSKQKRHQKAHSQYSLSQSMNGLTTNSSREVSPLSNLMPSQESSPQAVFNKSPSPITNMDFMNGQPLGSNPGMWPQGLDMAAVMPMPPQIGRQMPHPNSHDMSSLGGMGHYPMFHQFPMGLPDRFQLFIHPTPFKSRVETQIPIKMSLFPLPRGVKRLHLPSYTISKPKLLARPTPELCPDMLELSTMLVCTSAMSNADNKKRALKKAAEATYSSPMPMEEGNEDDENMPQNGGEVRICAGCITRERKRAARKKIKKVEEEELWSKDENRRVIVFNTLEIKEWQPATTTLTESAVTARPEPNIPPGSYQVECPMRIACYCRHQSEKMGFQVIFTIKDFQGNVMAQDMSSSIMITDDHKTHSPPNLPGQTSSTSENNVATTPAPSSVSMGSTTSFAPTQPNVETCQAKQNPTSPYTPVSIHGPSNPSTVTPTPRNLSRPASPGATSGPSAKKRKASGSMKLPTSLAMTPRNAPPPISMPQQPRQPQAVDQTSPFTPSMPSFPMTDSMFPGNGGMQPFATGPPTPNSNSNEHILFANANRSSSMDNMAMPQLYSAPTSAHPSRAPSPNGLRNSTGSSNQAQLGQSIANGIFPMPMSFNPGRAPVIHKIIPNEGPKSGGIEVTILGSGFSQGLEVMFGDQRATTTTFWGETSLVCLLPPSTIAGTVYVTFKQQMAAAQAFPTMTKQQPIFKYIDDDEQQLIRSALAVLGQKMTGKMEDARELARRILGDGNSWGASGGSGSAPSQSGGGGFSTLSFSTATETQLLKVLELIDLDDSTHKCRLNLRRTTGQTMLHLACALGLHRLVAGLISRGANPDSRDKGGFTPMHLAAMNSHLEIVRRLVSAGGDPTMRSLSGLTPANMAPCKMARSIRKIERFARSRRGGSLHSRANSATSLRSLWEGPSASSSSPTDYSDEPGSDTDSQESPEYSSHYNSSSEAEDMDDGQILGLRRRSVHTRSGSQVAPHPSRPKTSGAGNDELGLPSPSATMAAWKEQMATQLQQFQQAVAGPFQSIAQFPNLPVFPTLQDYQVYLASLQGMRRLAGLMPNIVRPGSSPNEHPSNPADGKWWDSLFPSPAPPAYEDLYPRADLDKKQASAAQAAAEAEADLKCSDLYDDEAEEFLSDSSYSLSPSEASTPQVEKRQLPALLQIGRRHAITQEQRENLQQLHSEKLVRCSNDRKLFFIWIPMLLIVICAFLHSAFPSIFHVPTSYLASHFKDTGLEQVRNRAGAVCQNAMNDLVETIAPHGARQIAQDL
ncbi:hypothetical protein MKZ38_006213 [Zalerion maritima]|uniref:IPT/TIG domain-containing protein n=1 Tax=Zalerion maritima TaxID=339359 RepID=A0AAD5WUJ4_9PEZI|nr:hypothetical protein MKZ38_006213 [Zalerion maritima]